MNEKKYKNACGSRLEILRVFKSWLIVPAALLLIGLAALIWQPVSYAGENVTANDKNQQKKIWSAVERAAIARPADGLPDDFRAFRLDRKTLVELLGAAPHESLTSLRESRAILPLPLPDGRIVRFRIQEAPVLESALAARFPEIKSYRALGVDDPLLTGRFDLTPDGLHATLIAPGKTISVLPAATDDAAVYASYEAGREPLDGAVVGCSVGKGDEISFSGKGDNFLAPQIAVGQTLRTYRLAVSTTYEYTTDIGGGTVAGTVATINTWLNGLNAIYERELSIRVIMVNNTNAIYTTNSDPYDDAAGSSDERVMLNQGRNVLRDQVGEANYNVGHLLARNANGGVAAVGVICSNSTVGGLGALKGAGVSPLRPPLGNFNSLKLLVHEFGHQFGAIHTFNGTLGSCAPARNNAGAVEPGGGNTIMSYFAICGGDGLVGISDLRFHSQSFTQITNYVISGNGASCGTNVSTGNDAPAVSAGANYTIPKFTPFTLTATASDPNTGDQNNLSYTWEQFDVGGANYFQNGTSASYNDAGDPAATTRPIFRALPATNNPSRTFPSLEFILNNANDPPDTINNLQTAEELPRISRTLNFRVTARDNAGGVDNSAMVVTVDGASGPFTVNDPNGTWTGGSTQTVTWNVNNTNTLAANVKISLSTDGGLTFPATLVASTANDGSENIIVPSGINSTTARVKIEAVGNIFFDISGGNFNVVPGDPCPIVNSVNPLVASVGSQVVLTGTNFDGATAVTFGGNVGATNFTVNSNTQITATVPNGAQSGSIFVTKPGCAAAQSPGFTVCPGSLTNLQIDDGTIETVGSFGISTNYFVNRLTPASYPATLSSVTIVFPAGSGFPANAPLTILSGTTTDDGVNNVNFQTRTATAGALNVPVTFNVNPITITSGDFVVGYSISSTSNFGVIAVDTGSIQNRSFRSTDGVNFTASVVGNFLIRAGIYTGSCSSVCTYTLSASSQNFTDAGGTGTITITTQAGCPWLAARNNNWITLTSPASGTGSGILNFAVAANTGESRAGSITVGGQQNSGSNLSGQDVLINQSATSPAATVSITGRVLTADGRIARNVRVILREANGESRSTQTTVSGNYRFYNVAVNQTVTIEITSKRYRFAPRVINVANEITGLDFTALP